MTWAAPPSQLRPAAAGIKLTLRDYQQQGLDGIRNQLKAGKRAVLYVLPTGGGKTVTYAAMAAGAAQKGNRILILEHRKELIRQASLAVGGLGVRHQIVAPPGKVTAIRRVHVEKIGWPMIDKVSHVAVASVQTLARRMDWLEEFNPTIIVIDEAHHAVAGTWKKIIEACPNSVLIGVTATPCRTDGQGLGEVFDSMVLGPSMADLIADGFLVPFRVFAPPRKADLSKVRRNRDGERDLKEQARIMSDKVVTGDAVEHYTRLAPGRPAIVFCPNVQHAVQVADAFKAAGYRFEPVFGDMDDDLRDSRIGGLADGRLQGIVTVDIAGEGTDIPAAEVGIMLRFTESEGLFLQQAGRLTRPTYAPGYNLLTREGRLAAIAASTKQFGLLIDHVGNVGHTEGGQFKANHGAPHAEREWSLDGRSGGVKAANDDGPDVRVTQCPKCYFTHEPAPSCPDCGHVYEFKARAVKEVEGTLDDVTDVIAPAKIHTGSLRDQEAMNAAGVSAGRSAHILAARAEKARLQNELRELIQRWRESNSMPVREAWGFSVGEIGGMKPKALRQHIEKVGEALFLGSAPPADNDNIMQVSLGLA